MKSYSELILLDTFVERFEYLKIDGVVGEPTFGYCRYLNQQFYTSTYWIKEVRPYIILRDGGNELGLDGYPIKGNVYIHHIERITIDDIINRTSRLSDPDNLISMSSRCHRALHYGDISQLILMPAERTPNDTCPWR